MRDKKKCEKLKPPPPSNPPKVTLTGKDTDFTLSPMEAQTMKFFGGMMTSGSIHQLTHEDLQTSGFDGWWNSVEKLIGCIESGDGRSTFIAQILPWDGAAGGRLDTIIRHTDTRNKRRVRDFFTKSKTLPPILGECIKHDSMQTPPPSRACPGHQLILLSRYLGKTNRTRGGGFFITLAPAGVLGPWTGPRGPKPVIEI